MYNLPGEMENTNCTFEEWLNEDTGFDDLQDWAEYITDSYGEDEEFRKGATQETWNRYLDYCKAIGRIPSEKPSYATDSYINDELFKRVTWINYLEVYQN